MLSCKGWLPWRLAYLSRMAGLAAVLTQMCLLQTSDTPTACCACRGDGPGLQGAAAGEGLEAGGDCVLHQGVHWCQLNTACNGGDCLQQIASCLCPYQQPRWFHAGASAQCSHLFVEFTCAGPDKPNFGSVSCLAPRLWPAVVDRYWCRVSPCLVEARQASSSSTASPCLKRTSLCRTGLLMSVHCCADILGFRRRSQCQGSQQETYHRGDKGGLGAPASASWLL